MSGYIHYYRQCWLVRGNTRQMAWIPEKADGGWHLGRWLAGDGRWCSDDGKVRP
jgi:hypothetical protein